jgi:hypothetical protein
MAHEELTTTIRFRATAADVKKLSKVAKYYDRSPSDVMRRLIAEAERRIRPLSAVPDAPKEK